MKFSELSFEVMRQRKKDGLRGLKREWSRYRCHVATAKFFEMDVAKIGTPLIWEWVRDMADKPAKGSGPSRKLSKASIDRSLSLVSAVFGEAVQRELRKDNPCNKVKAPKRVSDADTEEKWAFLTLAEQIALATCEAIPLADRLAIRFAIATGIRQSEQSHLGIDDLIIDDPKPRIIVRVAGRREDGSKLPPKSGKRRVVPLFGDGLTAAKEWLAILPTYASENPERLVFPNPRGGYRIQGKPLGKHDTLKRHYVAAGIKLRKGLHWHALRHTCATNLITGVYGTPWRIELIRAVMGHSSVSITERYAHLGEDEVKLAARETAAAFTRTA